MLLSDRVAIISGGAIGMGLMWALELVADKRTNRHR